MDENEARDIAVDFLLTDVPDAVAWKMQGPSRQTLSRSAVRRECFVFGFWPPSGSAEEPVQVGVDLETGEVFLL